MSFGGYNGRSRTAWGTGGGFAAPFSNEGGQAQRNQANPQQANDSHQANTWQEQNVSDVYRPHNEINSGYSANQLSQDRSVQRGTGNWPADPWQSWRGTVAGNRLQDNAANKIKPLQCNLCNIDFTDRKHYESHCAGMLHKQKVHEQESQEETPDKVAETGGGPWQMPFREPHIAHMASRPSGEGRMGRDEPQHLRSSTQRTEKPCRPEQQSRDLSQSFTEQTLAYLKPILKTTPVKAPLAQSSMSSQFPGANRRSVPVDTSAGGRSLELARSGRQDDTAEQYSYGSWNTPYDEHKPMQQRSSSSVLQADHFSTVEQFQRRNDQKLFSAGHDSRQGLIKKGPGEKDIACNTPIRGSCGYPDSNASQSVHSLSSQGADSGRWWSQDISDKPLCPVSGTQQQTRDSEGDRYSGAGMYDREQAIPGLDMLSDQPDDMDRQPEWYSQQPQQTGLSSNAWEKGDQLGLASKPVEGALERGTPYSDWKQHERGRQSGSYEQCGMIHDRMENQYERGMQSSQITSKPTDTLQGRGMQSDCYEPQRNIHERSLQSSNYGQYGMLSKATESQYGRSMTSDSYEQGYEQQEVTPKLLDSQRERGQQSSLYDKLQMKSKSMDSQQGKRLPSDNYGQQGMSSMSVEGLQGRGMPADNWHRQGPGLAFGDRQQPGLTLRHLEGQRGPGMTSGDRQQQGLAPRHLEGQHGPGIMPADRQQRVEGNWMPSTGSSTDNWHRSSTEPWHRPQDGGVASDNWQRREPTSAGEFRQPQQMPVLKQTRAGMSRPDGSLQQQSMQTLGMGQTSGPALTQTRQGSFQRPAPAPDQKGKLVCALCEIQLSQSTKTAHEASIKHCAKYLYKQIVLGCKDFGIQFPDAVFGLTDAYSTAPPAQKPVKLLIYRCGLVMKFECSACSLKCFGHSQWHSHIRSIKHLKFCESLISSCGLERFLDIYGVLPLVRPEEEESFSAREDPSRESQNKKFGKEDMSACTKDKVTTKKYEVTYPTSGVNEVERGPKLTVYEYSHSSTTGIPQSSMHNVPTYNVDKAQKGSDLVPRQVLTTDGVKFRIKTMSIDPELVSVPKIAEWDMEKASQQQIEVRRPETSKGPGTAANQSNLTVFEYSHTSRTVAPQPSKSKGSLDEESIKKIADTISDIKNASKQQDNSQHLKHEHTVKGIFPIVDYCPTTELELHSGERNRGTNHDKQTYSLERKDEGQRRSRGYTREETRGRSREGRTKDGYGFSEHTRAPANERKDFGVAKPRSRYDRSSERPGVDLRRQQTRDVSRRSQEHQRVDSRSQDQRRHRGEETTRHGGTQRSASRVSGNSEGSRKTQPDKVTKPVTQQKQVTTKPSSQDSRLGVGTPTKPSVQTPTKTAATKKAEELKQIQGKLAASKQSVVKQSPVQKDQGKLSTEKLSVKKITPEEKKPGKQTGSKPLVVKSEKKDVKPMAKTKCTGDKVPAQPAGNKMDKQPDISKMDKKPGISKIDKKPDINEMDKKLDNSKIDKKPDINKTNKKPDLKKTTKDGVAAEKQKDNAVKREIITQSMTVQKGKSVNDKCHKITGNKKVTEPLKVGNRKPEQPPHETGSSSKRGGERSDKSSRSGKTDSERSFSQGRERMSDREHSRPYRPSEGRGRPKYDQELLSSSRDRGEQFEGYRRFSKQRPAERHDPHGERHEPHGERHDPHGERHDPHGERHDPRGGRHDPHSERHDPHGERHDPHGDRHIWPARDENREWDRQGEYGDRCNEEEFNEDEHLQQWIDEEHWLDRFGEEEEEEHVEVEDFEVDRFVEIVEPEQESRQEFTSFRGKGRGRDNTWSRGGHHQFSPASHQPAGGQQQRWHSCRPRETDQHAIRGRVDRGRSDQSRRDIHPEPQMEQRGAAPEQLMDMDTAVAVFTQTLQQFANSLQGQTTNDRQLGGRVARLTPEEHLFVEQIEAMTGIHDAGTILSAIDILQNMDSKVIQTLGSLDPSVIQELFTGNLSLQGCGGVDMQQMVRSMLWSGGQGQLDEGMSGQGPEPRHGHQHVWRGLGRGRGRWNGRGNGRGRFQNWRGMGQKRTFYDVRGRGGPPPKRGRPIP